MSESVGPEDIRVIKKVTRAEQDITNLRAQYQKLLDILIKEPNKFFNFMERIGRTSLEANINYTVMRESLNSLLLVLEWCSGYDNGTWTVVQMYLNELSRTEEPKIGVDT